MKGFQKLVSCTLPCFLIHSVDLSLLSNVVEINFTIYDLLTL